MKPEDWIKWLPYFCKLGQFIFRKKPKQPTHTPTALIVEDNDEDALLLVRLLKKRGINAEVASSAEMARGMVVHTFFEIVFIDMRLPGMPGQEFLQDVSQSSPNSKFIIVCGEGSDLGKLTKGKFVGVVIKPVGLETVEEILSQLNFDSYKNNSGTGEIERG